MCRATKLNVSVIRTPQLSINKVDLKQVRPDHDDSETVSCSSTSSRSSCSTRSAKKSVTFHKAVRVYPHIHLNDFEESEMVDTWYSPTDFEEVKLECTLTVKLVAAGKLSKTGNGDGDMWTNMCFRGLEFRTPEGAASRRENKFLGWDSVLDEQETQYSTGHHDAEAIARKYSDVSLSCQQAAHAMALEDARVVLEQDKQEPVDCSKTKTSAKTVTRRRVLNLDYHSRRCCAAA